jgi:hypothetical protein
MSQANSPPTSADLFFILRWQQGQGTPGTAECVAIQQRPTVAVQGFTLQDDPLNNRTLMTNDAVQTAVHVDAGETETVDAYQVAYCYPGTGTGGTGTGSCKVDFPSALESNDGDTIRLKIKTTAENQGVMIPNPSSIIEDPGQPGTYTNNPILLFAPSGWWGWSFDEDEGTFGVGGA